MRRNPGLRTPLPMVTTSDLSRRPGEVLRRVRRGERLIVCRHGEPEATLQPLDGYVASPFTGKVEDVFGWAFGSIEDQIAALAAPERALLVDGYRQWRLRPTRIRGFEWSTLMRALEDMKLRGLVRKTSCGIELTGRGLALREALLQQEGREA